MELTLRTLAIGAVLLLGPMLLLSCSGTRPSNLGVSDAGLAPCPSSPNCVSSDARDEGHRVPPFRLALPSDQAWTAIREAVSELPRTVLVTETHDYLHAECRSALFGFVDDLELHLRPGEDIVAIRSASRMGHSDLGVNRGRVEDLRTRLVDRGVLR